MFTKMKTKKCTNKSMPCSKACIELYDSCNNKASEKAKEVVDKLTELVTKVPTVANKSLEEITEKFVSIDDNLNIS